MKTIAVLTVALAVSGGLVAAQETKPVPNDSVRVAIPGCSKGSIFTVGRRTVDEPGSGDVPVGMHLRMNGPKKVMAEIKARERSMIVITGLMKKGQARPDGVPIGGGVRIAPGPGPSSGGIGSSPNVNQIFIDVEGWRPIAGDCPSR